MQSFSRERSGFHGNQPCYQQEHHELSRLESYRQHPHHGQTRQVYEAHALATATGVPPVRPGAGPGSGPIPGPKDCYNQQSYPGYPQGNGGGVDGGGSGVGGGGRGSTPHDKKAYSGGSQVPPPPAQHMQAGGYSNHMGPGGYPAQYMSEGHLQQSKWDDPAQLAQYEQEMVGRMEPGPPGSSQYLDQNMLAHSQSQCHQPHQASAPVYTSPHHQPHPPNPGQSPLMYPQSHLHYPQHSPSPSPSSSSYMEKCSPMPHCYKGYSMAPSSQYTRQMGSHSGLKQGGYRPPPQNSYSYQQTPSRGGYESQPPLQGMPTSQEAHPKYQHFSQPQQNYCLSELSVRSPEQYYQTCSPASSHSPARSVGRSPSYSSTPSPLMTNPESFQYSQPPMTPGAASSSSSSSAGLQDQGLLMPPRSHPSPSPNVAHPTPQHSYTQGVSMKERFSEKLLANPSLWSLNALTSQVENISNNVQQLLLSEAMVANKKGGKRSSSSTGSSGGSSKKEEEYKGVPGGPEGQHGGGPMQDSYSTNQHQLVPMEMQEGGYSSSSDEQLERGYYYCGQGRSPAQAPNNTHLGLDTASSCSMTSPDDMSTRSGDSVSGLQSVASRDNLTSDPRSQGGHDPPQTPMKSVGDERSPVSVTVPSPMKQESQSPPDIQRLGVPLKENFEELAWTEKLADYEDDGVKKTPDSKRDCRGGNNVPDTSEKQEKWPEEEKDPALYIKINKAVTEGKSYCYDENMYHEIQNKYDRSEEDSADKSPSLSDSSHKGDLGQEMKSESPTDSESSVKTSPFISRGDLDQDQYFTEKEDSSENTSPTPRGEVLDERLSASEKRESREKEEEEDEEREEERQQHSISPTLSAEEREGEQSESLPSTEVLNNRTSPQEEPSGELCSRSEGQSLAEPQPYRNTEPAETETQAAHPDPTAAAAESPERGSAICDTPPQSHSAMMVFSALSEIATPPAPAHTRDHIDRSDSNVLEPDSPQLPGKSILHSAPSWANTPPSPKKGDEDMEPGISCPSAVTPSAKPEPVAPSAHLQAFGRKHGRGRRRLMHSGVEFRRQLSVEREGESAPSPPQKPCMPSSKSALFSDQIDMTAHQDIMTTSETPKLLVEGSRSRMCTRSFNAQDTPPKDPQPPERRKPGRKPGSKPGPKPGPKSGLKPRPKPGLKPGPKPGPKPGLKPGPKPGLKPGLKPGSKPGPKLGLKPGPKPGPKPGLKPGPKPGTKPGPKPTEGAPRGRPRGTGSKLKLVLQESPIQPITGSPGRGQKSLSINSQQGDGNKEVKAPGKDGKNMVLRSRKPPQDKLPKEKEKEQSEGILTQSLTSITQPNAVLKNEERTSIEQALPVFPNETDTSVTNTSITDKSVTNTCVADTSVTDTRVTDTSIRDTSVTDTSVTDTSVTDTSVKDTIVIDTSVTDTNVTDTSATDTSATDTSVTDTSVTDTNVTYTSVTDTSKTDISKPVAPPEKPKEPTAAVPPVTAPVPPLKRKPSPLPLEPPVKKKRGPKPKPKPQQPQSETPQSDQASQANQANQPPLVKPKEMGVRGPKRRLKRGRHLKASLITVLTKDNHPPTMADGDVVSEIPSVPSQCPTKTKYLPPRKGRGLKYEAMVQKINLGTGSKKHPPTPQPETTEATVEEVTFKPASIPVSEESEAPVAAVSAPKVTREEIAGDVWSTTGVQNTEQEGRVEQNTREGVQPESLPAGVPDAAVASRANKPTRTKRRKWAMVESMDATVVAMETGSLIINTPRLAKQRAIKNNHEMHLKQSRKKRGEGPPPSEGPVADEQVETTTGEQQAQAPTDTTLTTTPALPASPGEITDSLQVITTEKIQQPPSKRGRKPSSSPSKKRGRGRAPGEQQSSKPLKVHKKPGPKKGIKDAVEVIEAVVKAAGREARLKKKKLKKERLAVSEGKQPEPSLKQVLSITPISVMKRLFCPYVHIDSSRDFASLCTIVNRRDEELKMVLQKLRKKSPDKIKNPVMVAKAIPSSSAMLQGPLVNKTLIDRCLTCCLCGKPANYRELGDLCGPYYPEDSIPRKILSARHVEPQRGNQGKTTSSNSSMEEPSSSEGDPSSEKEGSTKVDIETVTKEASTSSGGGHNHQPHPHHWRPRRAERTPMEGRSMHRPTLRGRFRRMQQIQEERRAAEATASGQEGGSRGGLLQRLQGEAEAKEHWAHENCAIWTNGVIMVAGRLYGLKEAVHTSTETSCSKCQRVGASISCCWKGCPHKYHYICAKEIGCTFQEDNFSLKCPKHEAL